MGIIKEVPVILNSTSQDIDYEGGYERDTRVIIWTLSFTVKGHIFGKITDSGGPITHSITSIYNQIDENDVIQFTINPNSGVGTYQIGETVYQGFSAPLAIATGKVVSFNNNLLQLKNINGNFVSSLPIRGVKTNANYMFTSYNLLSQVPVNMAQIIVTPNPHDVDMANVANGQYGYVVSISEEGGQPSVVIGNSNNQIVYVPPEPFPDSDVIDLMDSP
jgi:hypothetical protein